MDEGELLEILKTAWCRETAYHQDWDENCPSLNQCCVTALVVQDYLGGDILWANMEDGDQHYWNLLTDGTVVDLTSGQFDFIGVQNPSGTKGNVASREKLLQHNAVRQRYKLLLARVQNEQLIAERDALIEYMRSWMIYDYTDVYEKLDEQKKLYKKIPEHIRKQIEGES